MPSSGVVDAMEMGHDAAIATGEAISEKVEEGPVGSTRRRTDDTIREVIEMQNNPNVYPEGR